MLKRDIPKVLLNDHKTDGKVNAFFHVEPLDYKLYVEGECDSLIRKLVADCGWSDEFDAILPNILKKNNDIHNLTSEVKDLSMNLEESAAEETLRKNAEVQIKKWMEED